jgi:ABC-2 type transport system ATP-binding protein
MDTPSNLRKSVFGRKVVVHLRAADDSLAGVLRRLPFVREVNQVEDKLVVGLDDPETHNPEMIRTLVNAGADVVFVGELRHSLEDVYLQLVKGV